MKKWILIYVLVLCLFPVTKLAGSSQEFLADRLDIERFLPVQTMGIDKEGSGVTVSLSTGGEQNTSSALVMKSSAPSIETALTRLQDYSPKDELYYDHIQYIILGEDLAEDGLQPILDWIERSPFMRIDTDIFLVKGSAQDAIQGASGEIGDITERLSSLHRESDIRSQHIYTLLEIAVSLADRGTALCSAIESVSSQGTAAGQSGPLGDAVLPAGYGVLKDGKLTAYLTMNESLGAALFYQNLNGTKLLVGDATLVLLDGTAKAEGQWSEDGELSGILVTADLKAGILEQGQEQDLTDLSSLEEEFAVLVQSWLEETVSRSQKLSCDYLALEEAIYPSVRTAASASSKNWENRFPDLPVTVIVQAEIQRGYDRNY